MVLWIFGVLIINGVIGIIRITGNHPDIHQQRVKDQKSGARHINQRFFDFSNYNPHLPTKSLTDDML